MSKIEMFGVECEVVHFVKEMGVVEGSDPTQVDVVLEFRTDLESAKAIFQNTPWIAPAEEATESAVQPAPRVLVKVGNITVARDWELVENFEEYKMDDDDEWRVK